MVNKLDVGVLINNVGMSYKFPKDTLDVPPKTIEKLMNLNVHSVVRMSNLILPGMVERKRGTIVNISSSASTFAAPMLAYYGATKSYVNTLSRAMNAEYGRKNISVQVRDAPCCPTYFVWVHIYLESFKLFPLF